MIHTPTGKPIMEAEELNWYDAMSTAEQNAYDNWLEEQMPYDD